MKPSCGESEEGASVSERRVKEYDDSEPRELGLRQRLGEVSLRAPGEGSVR